jgi:hypothetical protein
MGDNLQAAVSVSMKVRAAVPFSTNTAFTSSPILRQNGQVINQVEDLDGVRPSPAYPNPNEAYQWIEYVSEVSARCLKHKKGNCGELAAMACLLLFRMDVFPVEYVMVTDKISSNPAIPHAFAVVGRTANQGRYEWPKDDSEIGLPNAWHADAAICDPWDRTAYPAKEYGFFWKNLMSKAAGQLTCVLLHQF